MTDSLSYAASHLPPDERGARWRLIGLSFLACTLVAALGYAFYLREAGGIESRLRERESVRVGFLGHFLESDLQPVEHDLHILADGEGLHAFLATGTATDLERAARRAVFVSRLRPNYDQVRFLDSSGHEVLRIDHDGVRVPDDQLQDKSDRPYVQVASTLGPGQLYVSVFDLNVENGRISTPFKPMLRFATPVFDRAGARRGVYVINVLGGEVINRLQQSAPGLAHRLRLLDARGYWLKAASPEQEWGFQLPGRAEITLARSEPRLWSRILADPRGQAQYRGGLFTWQHVSPTAFSRDDRQSIATDAGDLIIASEVSAAEFDALLASLRQTFFVLTSGLLALTLGCVWIFDSRRRALATLRRNEESLSVTLHSIGDAVLATDTAGKVTRMNRIAEKLTGWTQAEASGRPIGEVFRIVNEETRLPSRIPVDDVLATGEIKGLANHTVLIARTGQEYPIADSAAPIMDRDGAILGVVLAFRDVTEEYIAAKALRESDDRYRTLFESIDEGFCIIQMIFDDHDIGLPVSGDQPGIREADGFVGCIGQAHAGDRAHARAALVRYIRSHRHDRRTATLPEPCRAIASHLRRVRLPLWCRE
jgi:PAS domain S-box-containing protein